MDLCWFACCSEYPAYFLVVMVLVHLDQCDVNSLPLRNIQRKKSSEFLGTTTPKVYLIFPL